MPWRNQNFWEWLYDIFANYGSVIYGFILAVAISVFSTAKKYGKVDWLEAMICGLLVLAFSSVLDWLGWPQSVSLVIAGIVGFKGTLWVDQKFNKFWDRQFDDEDKKIMNIDQFITDLIQREGGYVNIASDRGGATKYGITEAVARANGYQGQMRDLPRSLAESIYKKQYWISPRFDQINTISAPIAEELLDTGVNCGTGFAKPLLQRALNLLNNQGKLGYADIEVDGVYGNQTMSALKTYLNKRGKDGEKVLVRVLNIMQGQRYIEIAERNKSQEQFFYGWILNRIVI